MFYIFKIKLLCHFVLNLPIPLSFLKSRCKYHTRSGREIPLEKKDFDKETFKLEIESSDAYYRQLTATD